MSKNSETPTLNEDTSTANIRHYGSGGMGPEAHKLYCMNQEQGNLNLAKMQSVIDERNAAQIVTDVAMLKSRLAGAVAALKSLRECVPPRDWNNYAQAVIDLYEGENK